MAGGSQAGPRRRRGDSWEEKGSRESPRRGEVWQWWLVLGGEAQGPWLGSGAAAAALGWVRPPDSRAGSGLHGTNGFRLVLTLVCPLYSRKHMILILLNCVLLQGRN